ncbi:MAG: pitrilysin family protein, partial [Planctomycetota bacterium]
EHMLFKGTPTHPNIPKALKDRGAGQSMNGTTWTDRTNYYETLPATGDNLEFAVRLEADRLVNSSILAEDLASEMTVVRNEFESGENEPTRVLMQRIQAAAYDWHNYGRATIGNRSDIERVPVEKLRDFYRKYYRPDNVMVVVAGKFESESALNHIEKHFGALSIPEEAIDETYTIEPPKDGERSVIVRRVSEIQLAGAAYHIPSSSHPDYPAIQVLSYILGDEPSGRLYRQLVETEVASQVFGFSFAFAEPGLLMAMAEVPVDNSIERATSQLIDTLERSFLEDPITQQEVDRSVQQILKSRELAAAETDKIAISLSDWAAQGDWRLYFLHRDRLENVTLEDVQRVAKTYLVRNNRTAGMFIPSAESDRVNIPSAPNLSEVFEDYQGREAMEAGEQIDPEPMAIEARTHRGELMEGMTYALLPKKTRGETCSLALTLRFGTGETLKGKVAAAELLGLLMSRGTDKLNYQQLQDELTRLRADVSISSTVGLLQTSMRAKRENLPEIISLVGELLRRPRLDADELEVIRRQIVTNLSRGTTEPQAIAPRSVRKRLSPYSTDHVLYVPTVEEEIEMFGQVTMDEIKALHAEFIGVSTGEFSMVGDFDPDEMKQLIKAELDGWNSKQPYVRVGRDPHPEIRGGLEVLQTPDKANAFFYCSQQYALSDTDPAYASLVLGNLILGGGSLSSRLGNRVRQQEGLSYGVRSSLTARAKDNRVDFTVYAITNAENKDRLMEVIRDELLKLTKDGVTDEELAEAKTAFLQASRVRRTNDTSLTSELLGTIFNGRTMSHHAEHEAQIESATTRSVHDAIGKYIDPDRLTMAIAGDFEAA